MKVCRNCNQINPPEAMFCRQCAFPLDAAQSQQQVGNRQQFGNQAHWNQSNFGGNQGGMQQNFSQASGSANNRAMLAAGLAVVGFLCCFVGSIPAALLGWLEISAIKEGKSSPEGMLMAQIGLWGGIVGGLINAFSWLIFLFIGGMGGGY